ncbi:hypothetical protein [Flammeovirga agarivorans]|uniref:Uncharacterized protein n=1 Tax=Flammeovirga agarivorans TaxID=2726742 RepID=A0A7X8SR92_9BACT|nr:hypothetical protein [Flammeovirga agarivorans]NLR94931.1 hypothetical protein [Flammeovirga agarivorans]
MMNIKYKVSPMPHTGQRKITLFWIEPIASLICEGAIPPKYQNSDKEEIEKYLLEQKQDLSTIQITQTF